jgi:DNA polymerase III sliding clamp (beta) subunit (PCNA family)
MENGTKAADIRREIELEIEELAQETDRAEDDTESGQHPATVIYGSFTLPVKTLKAAIDQVARFVSKSIMPILGAIHFEYELGLLEMSATDLDAYSTIAERPEGYGKAEFALPAKELKDMVKRLKGTEVTFSQEGDTINLDDGRVSMSIQTMPVEDFPFNPGHGHEFEWLCEHGNEEWRDAVGKAITTASKDKKRPVLEGVLFEYGQVIKMVSTDSYRLSTVTMRSGAAKEVSLLVPRESLARILKLKDKKSPVHVAIAEGTVKYNIGQAVVYARLIEGKFPEWVRLIPEHDEAPCFNFMLNREEALAAIDAAGAGSKSLVLEIEGDELKVSGKTRDNMLSTSTKVKISNLDRLEYQPTEEDEGEEPLKEPEIKKAYEEGYLKDGISMMEDTFSVHLHDGFKPMVMRSDGVCCLVMPIKL